MGPLEGFRIIEAYAPGCPVPLRLAGGLAGRVLADLGARVSVQAAAGDDPLRDLPGAGALFAFLDAGKRVLPPVEDGAALVADHDGAVMDARSFAALRPASRAVAVVSMLPGGDAAPASELTVMALAGVLDIVGDPAREPLRLGGHQAAYAAGLSAFTGLLAALCLARAPGAGPRMVRVNLLDTLVWINWKSVIAAQTAAGAPSRQGPDADWQVVRCADGWTALVYQDTDWPALRALVGPALDAPAFATQAARRNHRRELAAAVEAVLSRHTRDEVRALALERRLPLGPVWSLAELLEDRHCRARGTFRPAEGFPGAVPSLPVTWNGRRVPPGPAPDAPPRAPGQERTASGALPLDGCRVVDFGIITAGAATSALLADLGAEVIKVESPTYRDPFRAWSATEMSLVGGPDSPPFFRSNNRNKRGLSIDLKHPDGRAALLRLAARSDVVLENFRRGVLDRLGLDAAALHGANPELLLVSVSGQGTSGPDAGQVTFGSTLEAVGGLAWLTGYPGGPPVVSGRELNYPDQVVALFAAGAVLAARLGRDGAGGAALDVCQRELTSYLLGERFLVPGDGDGPARAGNASPFHALQGCYRAADGRWAAVSVGPDQLDALAACLGAAATEAALAAWVAGADADSRVGALSGAGIAAAAVLTGGELARTAPWSHAIGRAPDGVQIKAMPFAIDGVPFAVRRDAPGVGQDSAAVLRDIAGYDDAAVAALVAAGVVECAPGPAR